MKWLAKTLATTLIVVIISIALEFAVNGVPLFGVPEAETVAAVTVTHPRWPQNPKRFTDETNIDLACKLPNFLRWSPWKSAEESEIGAFTITYELANGGEVWIAADEETVQWRGKTRTLADDNTFVNLTEGIFFLDDVMDEETGAQQPE